MCNSAGLQAAAAVVGVIFAVAGFVVLCIYARDTRTIAVAATNQGKDSVIPFLALDLSPIKNSSQLEGDQPLSWKLENHGFGPAINVKIWLLRDDAPKQRFSLMTGDKHTIVNFGATQDRALLETRLKRPSGVKVAYSSLAGEDFLTTFRRSGADPLEVTFENLTRPGR